MSRGSSSYSSSSFSAASAVPLGEGANDAAQYVQVSAAEKRHEWSSTQPHVVPSAVSSSTSTSMLPPLPGTSLPRRPRTLSEASSNASWISRSPRRKRSREADVASQEQLQQLQQWERESSPRTIVRTADMERSRRAVQASRSTSPLDSCQLSAPRTRSSSSTRATMMMTPPPQAPASISTTPLQTLSRSSSSSSSSSSGFFEIMLNHARVNVDRRYPFLNPTSLFTARATPSDSVVPPNLHRYGNRPVLLLDSTGALYLQMQRRARRQEILTGIGRLLAERADLIQTARVWRMRLLRSTRRNSSVFDVATSSIPTGEQAEEEEGEGVHTKSIVVVHEGVRRSAADVQHLIRSTGARRAAITLELKALRSQLAHLTQAKRYGEATREGCVLLLPSPVTHEVRLCSGHHYRTVCFVGEELMDIVPGDGLAPPPLSAPSSLTTTTAAAAARRSLSSEAGSRPPHHSPPTVVPPTPPLEAEDDPAQRAAQPPTPSWVNAELSGYTIFRRLRAAEEKRRRHGGRRGRAVSGDGDSSDEATATLNAYLALSACEAAMYREWGIQKYGLF